MMRGVSVALVVACASAYAHAVYIESVAASVDAVGTPADAHSAEHMPMVAFQCGHRNQYLSERGIWTTDPDTRATCKSSPKDVLDYCRKVYGENVSNIVEYAHTTPITRWCKESGYPCTATYTVRPFRCIKGELGSEALSVPEHCRFGHADEGDNCAQFDYWQTTAQNECGRHAGDDGRTMRVRSFAVLAPCAVGKFKSVEYVCCPQHVDAAPSATTTTAPFTAPPLLRKAAPTPETIKKSTAIKESDVDSSERWSSSLDDDSYDDSEYDSDEDDDDWDDDYVDDDDSFEDDDESVDDDFSATSAEKDDIILREIQQEQSAETTTAPAVEAMHVHARVVDKPAKKADIVDALKATKPPVHALGADNADDPYFRLADPDNEHALYREAVARLEKKHNDRVSGIMKQWADAMDKYEVLKRTDDKRAGVFKHDTQEDLRRLVAALDAEMRSERAQLDEVHQERVQAKHNQRKRDAIRHYRDVLAQAIDKPHPHDVLEALKEYMRAEEKDRMHILKHYRFLVKSDARQADDQRDSTARRLQDIDLRVNGTLAMLKDFPHLFDKVQPVALKYWVDYRAEHAVVPAAAPLTTRPADVLAAIERDISAQIDGDAGSDSEEMFAVDMPERLHDETIDFSPELVEQLQIVKGVEPVLSVQQSLNDAEMRMRSSRYMAEQNSAVHHYGMHHMTTIVGICAICVVLIMLVVFHRRRSARHNGFIEVDLYTPEERHVASMQHSGYENPTYTYFEKDPKQASA